MQRFEYKVVPAPKRGEKARGLKSTEERFAHALSQVMNTLGADGWDYVRADTLPCDERSGLTGTKTTFQNMLVFRRTLVSVGAADTGETEATATPGFTTLRVPSAAGAPSMRLGSAQIPTGAARPIGPAHQNVAAE